MRSLTRSGPLAAARDMWQQNQDLLRNAGSLAASMGLASLFGFIYWVVAAREFSQEAVGYGSAAVSAMLLLGTIGEFGIGTMLIGELPKRPRAGGLTSASIIVSGLGSLILGLAFPPIADAFGSHFPQISGTPFRIALFVVGVALTGMTVVFDDAMIGLMRSGVQLSRNLVMSILKLALLPVVAVVLHDAFGVGLMFAWVLGTVLSMVPALIMLKRGGLRIFHRPDWTLLRQLGKLAMAHNWLNLAIMTPPRLIPVLVTIVVSASANAAFYVAWMLVGFLSMIPASLSIMLFAIASAAPAVVAEKLRFVLRLSLIIGIPAMAVLALGGQLLLKVFGSNYAHQATFPLLLLTLTYIPGITQVTYINVCRATDRVGRATLVLSAAALGEAISVIIGGKAGGLNGVAVGYCISQVFVGLVTAPTVLRTAFGKHAVTDVAGDETSDGYYNRQRAGLAALLAVSSLALAELQSRNDVAGVSSRSFLASTGPFLARLEESYAVQQRTGVSALLAISEQVDDSAVRFPGNRTG